MARLPGDNYLLLMGFLAQVRGEKKERCAISVTVGRGGSRYFTALRLKASLAGRSGHEAQGSAKVVGVRFPDPAQDTHLSPQLILPPLSTGPDQTLTREVLDLAIL